VLTLVVGTIGAWPMMQRAREASDNRIELVAPGKPEGVVPVTRQ